MTKRKDKAAQTKFMGLIQRIAEPKPWHPKAKDVVEQYVVGDHMLPSVLYANTYGDRYYCGLSNILHTLTVMNALRKNQMLFMELLLKAVEVSEYKFEGEKLWTYAVYMRPLDFSKLAASATSGITEDMWLQVGGVLERNVKIKA